MTMVNFFPFISCSPLGVLSGRQGTWISTQASVDSRAGLDEIGTQHGAGDRQWPGRDLALLKSISTTCQPMP